jgi:2-haloacid dehalogenase
MGAQAIVFDIGNVLIEWVPERYYDRTYGPEMCKRLFAEVDLHGMNDEIDRGGNFRDTVYACADDYPEFKALIRDWHDHWIELAAPAIPQSVRCLRALRAKNIPVLALTNFGIESFAYARSIYRFLEEFDQAFVSGHMGVIKPDPQIYAMVEDACGLPASELLFADDKLENIEAAKARGWQVHHFTGPEGWAERLVAEGFLSREEICP